MNHGEWTSTLGKNLKEDVEKSSNPELEVYCGHWKNGESCKIIPYFGEYGTDTTLSNADLAIVSKTGKKLLVLCEIEEEGAKPKLVIGDVANIFLADKVRINKKDYTLKNTVFILGVRVGEKGKNNNAESKVASIVNNIQKIVKKKSLRGIKVLTITKPTYEDLIGELEKEICRIINIEVAPK
jgi:hypothetical protein